MQQDIRDLLKEDTHQGNPKTKIESRLPNGHRDEFIKKLRDSKTNRYPSFKMDWFYKIAAVVLVSISLAYMVFNTSENETPEQTVQNPQIETQMMAVEKKFLASIDAEWERFVKLTEDKVLIDRYRNKLNDLATDYDQIATQFKADPNDIILIESLVENLQKRLQLLKDIQIHIEILNQKINNDAKLL